MASKLQQNNIFLVNSAVCFLTNTNKIQIQYKYINTVSNGEFHDT